MLVSGGKGRDVSLKVNKNFFCHPLFKSIQSAPLNAILCLLFLGFVLFYKTLNWQEQQEEFEN